MVPALRVIEGGKQPNQVGLKCPSCGAEYPCATTCEPWHGEIRKWATTPPDQDPGGSAA